MGACRGGAGRGLVWIVATVGWERRDGEWWGLSDGGLGGCGLARVVGQGETGQGLSVGRRGVVRVV